MRILVLGVGAGTGTDIIDCIADENDLKLADFDRLAEGFFTTNERYLLEGDEVTSGNEILRIVSRSAIRFAIPTTDRFVRLLSPIRTHLEEVGCVFLQPPGDVISRCLDRKEFQLAMQRAGINVPCSDSLRIQFPMVLKARTQKLEYNYVLIQNPQALDVHDRKLKRLGIEPYCEDYIPGNSDQVYVITQIYDRDSKLVAGFAARKLHELNSRGGLTAAAISLKNDELQQLAEKAVRAMGDWSGPATAKFKIQPTNGSIFLLSLKPRLNDTTALAASCGLNFPQMAANLAAKNQIGPFQNYRSDMIMVRHLADLICNPS